MKERFYLRHYDALDWYESGPFSLPHELIDKGLYSHLPSHDLPVCSEYNILHTIISKIDTSTAVNFGAAE